MQTGKDVLADSSPLILNKVLAKALGLRDSIILQQVWYWMELNRKAKKTETHYINGRWWMYNSAVDFQREDFDFWDVDTIRNGLESLAGLGLLITGVFNKRKFDKTKWYTVHFEALDLYISLWREHGEPRASNARKNQPYKDLLLLYTDSFRKLSLTSEETFPNDIGNFPNPIPETTPDPTTEKSTTYKAEAWFRVSGQNGKALTFPSIQDLPENAGPILDGKKYIDPQGNTWMLLGVRYAFAYLFLGYQYGAKVGWPFVTKTLDHPDMKDVGPLYPEELFKARGWMYRQHGIKVILDPEKIAYWIDRYRREHPVTVDPDPECLYCHGAGEVMVDEGDILEGVEATYAPCVCVGGVQ